MQESVKNILTDRVTLDKWIAGIPWQAATNWIVGNNLTLGSNST